MGTERPILFSAPMVRALLEGRKTQTRRVLKTVELRGGIKGVRVAANTFCYLDFEIPGLGWRPNGGSPVVPFPQERMEAASPYGRPGDRLWVKETWATPPANDATKPSDIDPLTPIRYAADGVVRGVSKRFVDADGRIVIGRTRPSIFMPRWASRITLEVTAVRVERLQAISDEDAMTEGAPFDEPPPGKPWAWFRKLWMGINGAESWAANPWVWVVSFKRVTS